MMDIDAIRATLGDKAARVERIGGQPRLFSEPKPKPATQEALDL